MNLEHFKEQVEAVIADCKRDFETLKPFLTQQHIENIELAIESIEFFTAQNNWSQCIDETITLNKALKDGWEDTKKRLQS